VLFEDQDEASVEVARLLPSRTDAPQWDAMTFDTYEITVPTENGPVEIPSFAIRAHTDAELDAYLAVEAAKQRRRIGLHVQHLRQRHGMSAAELATRAGVTPTVLDRIEGGEHEVVFPLLERILAAMGHTLDDLIEEPAEAPER
jgi:hypothetical protein